MVAPDGSLMKPEIRPRSDCAKTTPDTKKHTERIRAKLMRRSFMVLLPIAIEMFISPSVSSSADRAAPEMPSGQTQRGYVSQFRLGAQAHCQPPLRLRMQTDER